MKKANATFTEVVKFISHSVVGVVLISSEGTKTTVLADKVRSAASKSKKSQTLLIEEAHSPLVWVVSYEYIWRRKGWYHPTGFPYKLCDCCIIELQETYGNAGNVHIILSLYMPLLVNQEGMITWSWLAGRASAVSWFPAETRWKKLWKNAIISSVVKENRHAEMNVELWNRNRTF